ncbi:hypothetical protein FKP32DRAFT_1602611 [Trametes sanguinea]|nr:hypothetical protein FKP32DRAFT_1602611 [Trametes sanguinea]
MARDSSHDHHHSSSNSVKHEPEDSMPSTSDFVKKLYKMLEDTSFSDVVSWGPHGDCFVVKDMNEFTKSILPRMFKHSNFASFVRQLNKYDFHKVKNTDDNQYGEHSWTFRHPDFHADRRDALENIKRKVPAARKSTGRGANSPSPASSASVEALQAQIERMQRDQEEMAAHIRSLETNYQNVLSEMVNFQRNMAQQDGLMQNLIQYFLQLENGKVKTEQLSNPAPGTYAPDPNPFLPATEAQRMMGAYPDGDIARASLAQMNEISRRAEPPQFLSAPTPSAAPGGGPSSSITGGNASAAPSTRPGSSQTLRVRRSTYVPGWAVPPRVLLVDDDVVSRKVSSKFLQIFGCTIDVAVDGVGAVNKMNLEKYDLVLMDIVMPKLDGVSATSLIRQFDHMTPIISMTSNSKPAEIMKYYSSGMNDHLPKPFTQHGLWEVLEKHLTHLKVIQTLSRVPRSVGVPPLSDPSFDDALAVQASAAQQAAANGALPLGFSLGGDDDDGKINPLAGMGLTDEQYTLILQNLVNNESFTGVGGSLESIGGMGGLGLGGGAGESSKRPLDDASDGRDAKRSRFEVIE